MGHDKYVVGGEKTEAGKNRTIPIREEGRKYFQYFLSRAGDGLLMPLEVQSVLLRVLEEKTFRKVGGNNLIEVDVRIIAATNKNLKELIEQKLFREDLFYRLSIIRINIPPLKNRGGDVYLLAEYFIKKLCARMGKPDIRLSKNALEFLGKYS